MLSSCLTMNENNCIVLNWNAGGVNAMARWQVVREMVQDHQATAVCLKETNLNVVTESVIRETVGPALPADNMRGGGASLFFILFIQICEDQRG